VIQEQPIGPTTGSGIDSSLVPIVRYLLQLAHQTLTPQLASTKHVIVQAIVLLNQDPVRATLRSEPHSPCDALATSQMQRASEFIDRSFAVSPVSTSSAWRLRLSAGRSETVSP
jgi:hypothetical protein